MKKLLGLLAAFGMVATTSATVVACGDKDNANDEGIKTPTGDAAKVENGKLNIDEAIKLLEGLNADVKFGKELPTTDKADELFYRVAEKPAEKAEGEATLATKTFTVTEYKSVEAVKEEANKDDAKKFEFKATEAKVLEFTLTEKAKEESEKPGEGNEGGNTENPGEGNEGGNTENPGEGNEGGNTENPGEGNEGGNTENPGEGNEGGNTEGQDA